MTLVFLVMKYPTLFSAHVSQGYFFDLQKSASHEIKSTESLSLKTIVRDTIQNKPIARPKKIKKVASSTIDTNKLISQDANSFNADGKRYQVRVGTFSTMENALGQIEKLIKLGYRGVEIGKINNGKYVTIIAYRTSDLSLATTIADELEDKGIDALVYDTERKKGAKSELE